MIRGTESDPQEGCTSSHDLLEHRLFVLEKFLYETFPSMIEKLLRSNECRKWGCCDKNIPPGLWLLMDVISESEEAVAPKEILGKVRQRAIIAKAHKPFWKSNTSSKDAGFTILSTQTESRVEDLSSTDIPLDKQAASQSLREVEASLPTSVESAKSTIEPQTRAQTLVQSPFHVPEGFPSDTTISMVVPVPSPVLENVLSSQPVQTPLGIEIPRQNQLENALTPPIRVESDTSTNVIKGSLTGKPGKQKSSSVLAAATKLLQTIKSSPNNNVGSRIASPNLAPSTHPVQVNKKGTLESRNHSKLSAFTTEETSQDFNEALQNEEQFRQARNPVLPLNAPSPTYNNESDVDIVILSSDEESTILKPKRSQKKKGIKQHLTIVHPTPTTLMGISQPVPQYPAQPSPSIIRATAPRTARKSATKVPATTASDIVAQIKELNRATEEQSPVHVQQQVVKQKDQKTGEMVHQMSTTSTGSVGGKIKGTKRKQEIAPRPESVVEEVPVDSGPSSGEWQEDDTGTSFIDPVSVVESILTCGSQQSEVVNLESDDEPEEIYNNARNGSSSQNQFTDFQKERDDSEGSAGTTETISTDELEDNSSPVSPSGSCSTTECSDGQDNAAEVGYHVNPAQCESDCLEDRRNGELSSFAASPEPPTLVSCQENSGLDIGMPSFSIPLKSSNHISPSDTPPTLLVPAVGTISENSELICDEPNQEASAPMIVKEVNNAMPRNDYYSDSDDSMSVDSVPQNIVLLEHDVSLATSAVPSLSAEPSKCTSAVQTPPAATITITTSSTPAATAASTHDVVTTVAGQLKETPAPPLGTTPVAMNLEDVSNIPSTSTKASNISPSLPEDGVIPAVNEKLSDSISIVPRRESTKKKSDFCKRCEGYFESLHLHNLEIHRDESEEEDEPDEIDSDGDEGMTKGRRKRKTPKRFMDNNYIYDSSGRKKISEEQNSVKNPAEQPVPPPAPEVLEAHQVRRKRGRPSKKQRTKHLTDTEEKTPKNQVVSTGDSNGKANKASFNSDDEPLAKRKARFNNNNRRRKISLKEPVSSNTWRKVDTFKSSSSDSDDGTKYRKRHKPHLQNLMVEGPVAGSSRSEYPHHYLPYPPHAAAAASPHTSDDENAYDLLANGNNQMPSILKSRLSQNDVPNNQSMETDVLSDDPNATHIIDIPSGINSQASTTTTAASTPNVGKSSFGASAVNGYDGGDDSQTEMELMEQSPTNQNPSTSKGKSNRKERRYCNYCKKSMLVSSYNKHVARSCPLAPESMKRGKQLNYASQTEDDYDSQVEDDNVAGNNNAEVVGCPLCGMKILGEDIRNHIKSKRCGAKPPEISNGAGGNVENENNTISENHDEVENVESESSKGPNKSDKCVDDELRVVSVSQGPSGPDKKGKRGRPKASEFDGTKHMCKFEDCEYIPETPREHLEHMEEHSPNDEGHLCMTCKLVFLAEDNMKEHSKSHTRRHVYHDATRVSYAIDKKLQPKVKIKKLMNV